MEPNKLYTYDRLSEFVDNYKEYVEEKTAEQSSPATEQYKYFNFETSPDAISSKSIGRFGSSLFTNSSWNPMNDFNGIDAWKMSLGKKMIAFKNDQKTIIQANKVAKLSHRINVLQNVNNLTTADILSLNVDSYDLLSQVAYSDNKATPGNLVTNVACKSGWSIGDSNSFIPSVCITPYAATKDTETGLSYPNMSILPVFTDSEKTNIISVEWTGYFMQPNGVYTIDVLPKTTNCRFFIWFGDKSVCEFLSSNVDLMNNSKSHYVSINDGRAVPIRIQCLFLGENVPDFNLDIKKTIYDTTGLLSEVPVNQEDALFNTDAHPVVLYTAFVSPNQQQFLNNAFQCYSNLIENDGVLVVPNNDKLAKFYKLFRLSLPDVVNLKYDYNSSNRMSYGTIPVTNTQYTIKESTTSEPFAYSIYNLNPDQRMGNTYQVNTKLNDRGLYPMYKFGGGLTENALSYTDNFSEKSGYYPDNSQLVSSNAGFVQSKSGLECKTACIDDTSCSHYFTFTSNGDNKCITNTIGGEPEFNRTIPVNSLIPIDSGSSSVFLRNYQIDISGGINCGTSARASNVIPVNNTNNYSNEFEYVNYGVSEEILDTPEKVGLCGNPEYKKRQNAAHDILYKNETYFADGTFKEPFSPDVSSKSKVTHAISDTSDAIRTNLQNEELYASKMDSISDKKTALSNNLIPKYKVTRQIMEDNPKYDYNGNTLLHFRNKAIPAVRDQSIMDNNAQYVTSQLMLSLGTLTAVTLVVFAIMLARE